jgi:hypothetical protein
MAVFRPGVPVTTTKPEVIVDAGLRPGTYRFQLVVVDRAGRMSQPDVVTVVIGNRGPLDGRPR